MFIEIVTPILLFILGVCLASFGNVLICRYPQWHLFGEDKFSECPKCHHRLMWFDLFPIFSYIFLKGKCRYCKEKISSQYIIVEFLGGFIFLLTYFLYTYCYHQGSNITMDIYFKLDFSIISVANTVCISLALLITLLAAYIDKKHKEIPLTFSITLLVVSIIHWVIDFIQTGNYQLNYLLGLAVPFVLFGLIYLISVLFFKVEPIGLGDVILFIALGFLMGVIQFIVILFFSTIICSIVESIKIKMTGKKETIPFVPYIFIGFAISAFFGELISNGYLNMIGVKYAIL